MRTFKKSVAIYVALCRETREDNGASHLSATRLINLTPVLPALFRLVAVVAVSLWLLWRGGVRIGQGLLRGLTIVAGLTLRPVQALTAFYRRLEIALLVIGIGVRVLIFGLTPAPIRV